MEIRGSEGADFSLVWRVMSFLSSMGEDFSS